MAKGITKEQSEQIFELILKFGGYGFNKSHSTRYAVVAFQTRHLKTYHPGRVHGGVIDNWEDGKVGRVHSKNAAG